MAAGKGGRGPGPWGGRPGGGQQPPDLEELLRRSQEKVKSLFPGGGRRRRGRKGLLLVAASPSLGLWLASGIYTVQPDEQGVGDPLRQARPRHRPGPATTTCRRRSRRSMKPPVTRVNRVEVGFRSAGQPTAAARIGRARRAATRR